MYGPDRLIGDLAEMGFEVERVTGTDRRVYAVIRNFEVTVGRFAGRVIDLGQLATPDYPRTIGSSLHVCATPQLFDYSDTVPGQRNIIRSPLGPDWRYWSHNLGWTGEHSTRRLLSKINTVFAHA